jgi:hypothetical protein
MKTTNRKSQCRADTKPCTDAVFLRLIQDLQTARRAKRKISKGLLPQSKRAAAEDLERGAFRHLIRYLDAKAWTECT